MSTGGLLQTQMAAPGLSARPPKKPSRLPLHRPCPSTDKSSSPASLSASQTENSHSASIDVSKRSEHLISGSRAAHKSTQVRLNRLSLQGRQSVADDVAPRRLSEPQAHPRPSNVTGIGGIVSAQNHLVNGGLNGDGSYAVRLADSPTSGVRMRALRSVGREQKPSLTSSIKSSSSTATDRHAAAARRVAEPRDTALSHHASTSSVDSSCSEHLQRHVPPVVPRRTVSLSSDNKQYSRDSSESQCRKPEMSRHIISRKSDEITSSKSGCFGTPNSRSSAAADQPTDRLQGRSDVCRSTSVSHVLRTAEHQRRSDNAIVEPRRRYYRLWRLSESDVDKFSGAGSMSTITSVDSSLSSSTSSSGTLTDDADESTDESTTMASRERQRLDRGQFDTSDVCSDRLACRAHVAPPSYRASIASGNKTRTSRCTSLESSSSELPSSLLATSSSRLTAENYVEDTQRIGNVRMTSHAPVTRCNASPSAPPQRLRVRGVANRPKNRPPSSSESETNVPLSPRRLPFEAKTAAAGHVTHSPPLAAVGRCQQTVSGDSSLVQTNSSVVSTSFAVKPPTSPPHCHEQTRPQSDAVKKATSAAGVSNFKSSSNHCSVSSPSKVAFQAPSQRASGIPNMRTGSKISSALRDTCRKTSTGLVTNAADKGRPSVINGRELVAKSVVNTPAGAMKPPTAAVVKHVRSSQSGTAYGLDKISRPTKSARDVSTPATKTQTSLTAAIAARFATRDREKTAATKRPPPLPPSKPFVPGLTTASDRRRVNVGGQKRLTSTDCLAFGSVRQQLANVCYAKSNSSVNVSNLSIEQASATKKSAKCVLNKNVQHAKSYDCISPLSNNKERQNCLQMHRSSISLVDVPVPPRKLVKPYSVINRCSTFGRKTTPPNVVHSNPKECSQNTETEKVATGNRSSLASRTGASELFDLPEVDEVECDCQVTAVTWTSTEEGDRSEDARRLDATTTTESLHVSPSTQQKSTERYRSEYSTFLRTLPPKDSQLIAETVQVASCGISLSHQDCVSVTIKKDKNDVGDNCSSGTRLPGNCKIQTDNVGYVELDKKSCIPAPRPVTLLAEIPTVEDAAADAVVDNYVVTYESDNIVMLDRAPVVDCLTPEDDVVSAEACQQRLNMHTDSVSSAPGEGGLSRTLPLSESGYDTWKSSQGSVAVATNCVDVSAEQRQKHEKDGTLGSCDFGRLKSFDTQSPQIISKKYADTEGHETYCPGKGSDTLALFKAGSNLSCESINSAAGASVHIEVKADDRCGESVSDDDESGRVADCSVEDSALSNAQMFVSICSDVAEPVDGHASSCTEDRRGSGQSRSQSDNAVLLGLADLSDICFSLQAIPSNDSDKLSTPRNTAHLDRFNEDARDASLLLLGMDHCRHPVDVEVSGTFDISADVGHDNISTGKTAADFDADKDCVTDVQHLDESRGTVSMFDSLTDENTASTSHEPSSTDVTSGVSDSVALDSYETICDDLLESIEDNASDSERPYPSSTCQPSALCSTAAVDESSEQSEVLRSVNDHVTVAVSSSGVDWKPTLSGISAVHSNSPPSAVTSGRLPVMTLRRVRTNFSVVYRQAASYPKASQSQQPPAHVDTKASSHEPTSSRVDHEPSGTVGCRRALAVLASKLDEHGRRRLVNAIVDDRAASKPSFQAVAARREPHVVADSPAISSSSQFRPGVSSSAVIHNSAATTVVGHDSDLSSSKPTRSSLNVADAASTRAESKLPVSSARSSVAKKPLTFRKLLSSKLTSVVRRTQTKSDVNK